MGCIRWTLALAMICGAGYASEVLAGSATLPDADTPAIGNRPKICVFPSQVGNTTSCQNQNICPNRASSPDVTSITATWDGNGHLLTITANSLNDLSGGRDGLFIQSDYTGNPSDMVSWGYFVQSGATNRTRAAKTGKNIPADGLYQVINSPGVAEDGGYTHTPEGAFGNNQDGWAGHVNGIAAKPLAQIGVTASIGDIDTAWGKISTSDGFMIHNFVKLSVPIVPDRRFTIGGISHRTNNDTRKDDRNDDDVVLVAGLTVPRKPATATMVLLGIGLAGLAGWRARYAVGKSKPAQRRRRSTHPLSPAGGKGGVMPG